MGGENKTGYLEVLVLGELEAESRTGYELMALLEKKLGSRPSPGSIYPLLKRMFLEKLISITVDGRKKTYSLTSLGKKVLKEKMKEKENSISKNVGLFKSIVRDNFCAKHNLLNIVTLVKLSRKISPDTNKLLHELKEELLDILLSENYDKNEKALNKEIRDFTKQLKNISKSHKKRK
jgi:DNA-binding PadR family transcriptional regulator